MKKKYFVVFILCVFYLSSLLAFDAEITAVKGKVEIKRGRSWIKAKKGGKIKKGSLISTGFKSEMTVKIDGSVIVVKALTRLKIEDIAKKNDAVSSEVFVNVGSIKANIKPASTKKVRFKVKTPVATASVRGTSGIISADGKLVGLTGTWAYSNSVGQEAAIDAGSVVSVDDNGGIVAPQVNAVQASSLDFKETLSSSEKSEQQVVPVVETSVIEEGEHYDYHEDIPDDYEEPKPDPDNGTGDPEEPKTTDVNINVTWDE